jgi:hypothetical protein
MARVGESKSAHSLPNARMNSPSGQSGHGQVIVIIGAPEERGRDIQETPIKSA